MLVLSDKKISEAMLHRCYLQHEDPQWRYVSVTLLKNLFFFHLPASTKKFTNVLDRSYVMSSVSIAEGAWNIDQSTVLN